MSVTAIVRSMSRQPTTTAVALVVLAVGIGATTAVFSVLYAVALRPLPWPDPDRIVMVGEVDQSIAESANQTVFQLGNVGLLRDELPAFDSAAGYMGHNTTLTGFGEPLQLSGAQVSVDAFRVLGVAAQHGRTFLRDDERQRREDVVVLSHALAGRLYESADAAVGERLTLDGEPREIVGVMAADFRWMNRGAEYWWPLYPYQSDNPDEVREVMLPVIARLTADASIQAATTQGQGFIDERSAQLAEQARERAERRAAERAEEAAAEAGEGAAEEVLVEAPEVTVRERVFVMNSVASERLAPLRDSLALLIGAVSLVLLMACTNVANLLLARGAHREAEMATRMSLGATRRNLLRLLFAESAALAAVGCLAGLGLAWGGVRLLRALGPRDLMDFSDVSLNLPVAGFAILAGVVSTLLFGLLPALQASGARPGRALGRGGGNALGGMWRGRSKLGWLRGGLTLAQVAMAIVLLAGAGLLANSFLRLINVDPGYQAEDLLTFRLSPPDARYPAAQRSELYDQVRAELETIPGVESAGVVNFLPLFRGRIQISIMVEGQPPPSDPGDLPVAEARFVSPGYMEAMKIPLLAGRNFDDRDRGDGEPVLVVNESFAKQLLPEGEAVGQRIAGMGEIVGVVGDVRLQGLDTEPGPTFYQTLAQLPPHFAPLFRSMAFVARTKNPDEQVSAVRSRLAAIDPMMPVEDARPMASRLSESVAVPRFFATVLGAFAMVALLLAVTGVYGVLAFNASRRAKETGIRLALGEQRGSVVRRTLFEGLTLTAVGILVGVAMALAASRALASFLFGVEPGDGATLTLVSLLLLTSALIGSLLPAIRASRVDPIVVLRQE